MPSPVSHASSAPSEDRSCPTPQGDVLQKCGHATHVVTDAGNDLRHRGQGQNNFWSELPVLMQMFCLSSGLIGGGRIQSQLLILSMSQEANISIFY